MSLLRTATLLLLLTSAFQAKAEALLLTGEIFSRQAQVIIVPVTTNWQARISDMVPEGTQVEVGDLVVEFDGQDAARQLEQQKETARGELAKTERDIAQLTKAAKQAEFAVKQAEVQLDLANMRAEIPEGMIGAIEFEENQLGAEEASRDLEDARKQFTDASKALAERRERAALDARKQELTEAWWAGMLENFTVEATQPGYVIYAQHPWTRAKFQEGDNVQTSFHIAQVANTKDLAIKVWINSVDRPFVEAGSPVSITFDAQPEQALEGRLESISDASSKRNEWGKGVYFEGVVAFERPVGLNLLPGMSALVEMDVTGEAQSLAMQAPGEQP